MSSRRSLRSSPSVPELMRVARGSYKRAIDHEMCGRGIDDMPRSGAFVLAYVARGSESVEEMVAGLGITRQSFSQLVDVLVTRGYLTRETHPSDRRRMLLRLNDRGRLAAEAIRVGTRAVDRELARRLSTAELAGLRRGLEVLGEIKFGSEQRRD